MDRTGRSTIRRAWTAVAATVLFAPVMTVAAASPVSAAATVVVTSGADSGPGTLRQVVADAAAGDTITFAVGTVTLTTGQILIDKNLTIRGNGPAVTTVTRSASTPRFRIFEVAAGVEATIDLLTVTGGDEVFGGGIYSSGRLTVARSRVTLNRGAVGAGIFNNGGDMSILNSALSFNTVDTRDGSYGSLGGEGGGISSEGGGSLSIRGSEVVGNVVLSNVGGSAGGIDSSSSTVSLIDSLVSSNTAAQSGGGVRMGDGRVTGSVIRDNSAGTGAGIVISGVVVMERTEVSGNHAHDNGGGITLTRGNAGTDLTATNVTVSENSAAHGSALLVGFNTIGRLRNSTVAANSTSLSAAVFASATRLGGGRYEFGTVTLQDTVVGPQAEGANCFTDPNGAPIGDEGNNLTFGDTSCGATITNADPHLGPLAANGGTSRTMALGGPAGIDAGSASCPATDQRRFPRAGTCDIGAYEANALLPDVVPPTCAVVPASGTLRDVAVQDGGRGLAQVVNVNVVNGWLSVPPFLPGTNEEVRVAVVQADPAVPAAWSFDVVDQVGNIRHCTSRTTTAVTSSANPSSVGQAVTFTATVTSPMGTPTGTVTFSEGQTTLGTITLAAGQATLTTSALTAGDHVITATYTSDGFWSASSGSTPQTVNVAGADLSVSVADAPDPVSLGDTFTYTVTVSNSGPSAATATSATLALTGVSRTVLSGSATQGPCSIGMSITCSLGIIPANGSATIVVRVEPNATGTIGATATATSAQPDPTGPNQAIAGTTVDNGHGCTIIGTPGNDSIFGTNGADVICALGGDDAVSGGNGDDVIYAGSGNDRSHGESLLGLLLDNGSDTIYGGPGDDTLNGGNGDDRVVDTEGTDSLTGGPGNDTLITADGSGGDTVTGGLGADVCTTDPNDSRNGC